MKFKNYLLNMKIIISIFIIIYLKTILRLTNKIQKEILNFVYNV